MSSYTTTQSTVLWILYDTTCIALILCTTFPDRHEMSTLPGSTVIEGVAITTTTNTAYGMMRHGERLEDEYEVPSPPGGFPYEVPSPPSSHQPLPPIPHLWPHPLQVKRSRRMCMSLFLETSDLWCDILQS